MAHRALAAADLVEAQAYALVAIAESFIEVERHLDVLAQIEVARMMEYGEGDPTLFDGLGEHYATGRRIEDVDTKPGGPLS